MYSFENTHDGYGWGFFQSETASFEIGLHCGLRPDKFDEFDKLTAGF